MERRETTLATLASAYLATHSSIMVEVMRSVPAWRMLSMARLPTEAASEAKS